MSQSWCGTIKQKEDKSKELLNAVGLLYNNDIIDFNKWYELKDKIVKK